MTVNIIKFLFYIIGLTFRLDFEYFFYIELSINILKNILYIIFAQWILYLNKMNDFYKNKLSFDKEFFMFSLNTNLAATIDLPVNTVTTFIMNKYLGFESISVYKIFEKIGTLVGKFSSPLKSNNLP